MKLFPESREYDYIVIGSGFGGSVSALRLAQKGYRVAVLEAGKSYSAHEYAKTNWNLRRFLWFPSLFLHGIQRITFLKNVLVLSGAGVGGGSLVYANTHYEPLKEFYQHPTVLAMGGESSLKPYYNLARRMLGVTTTPRTFAADEALRETATEMGFGETFQSTPAAVFFGKPDEKVADPYFGGEGPERSGCTSCGGCMVGCRFNAKNTLDKNYLYLARKLGVEIFPDSEVISLIALSEDGEAGYRLQTRSPVGFSGRRRVYHARGVVVAAGVLGSLKLLMRMKQRGWLARLSDRLGYGVRTNSETLLGISSREEKVDFSKGIAIASSVFPDAVTHIQAVRYPEGSDLMNQLAAPVLIDSTGGILSRNIRFFLEVLRNPLTALRLMWPLGFAKKSFILLVMQSIDNSIRVLYRRTFYWPFWPVLTSEPGATGPLPSTIPVANVFARNLARKINGIARGSLNETLLDIPMTAHILGGAAMGNSPGEGVVDFFHRAFGYKNLLICDGSIIPANLGVNPSLTITALAERAMSFMPAKGDTRQFDFEKQWDVTELLNRRSQGSGSGP